MGVASLTITPSDPLVKFLVFVPMTLCNTGLEFLVPEGRMFLPKNTKIIPLNWKLRQTPDHFRFLMPWRPQAKKEVTKLAS